MPNQIYFGCCAVCDCVVLVDFGGMPAPVLLLYRKFMLIGTER